MKAMVLAAGVGSRLDPLTAYVPKPLVPVANIPVMEHILNLLKSHGFGDVIANLHYLPDHIEEYFGDGSRLGVKLQFRREEKLSGDAGGVRFCRDFLDSGTFIVLMGDLLTDADLTHILKCHKEKKALASIGLKKIKDVSHFGVAVINDEGFIVGFQEKPKKEEALSDLASTGIYVLEPEVFEHMPKTGDFGFGRQLFPQLVQAGLPVLGVEIDSYWNDVGTLEQYWNSNFDVLSGQLHLVIPGYTFEQKGQYRVYTGEGAQIAPSVVIAGNVMIGAGAVIEDNVRLAGNVIVGEGCIVGPDSKLSDTILWAGSKVAAGATLDGMIQSPAGDVQIKVTSDPKAQGPVIQTQVRQQIGTCV